MEAEFEKAAAYVSKLPESAGTVTGEAKLKFYSHFKQAKEGPCTKSDPGLLHPIERKKWQAWKDLGEMSKEDAMKSYVSELTKMVPDWQSQ